MNRWSRRASTAAALVGIAWVAIGGASGVASAHAEFQQSTVSAGSTTTLTLDVPNERAEPRYTTTVRIQIASGWSAMGCLQPAGWTCSVGGGEIAFHYAGGPQQEAFSFTLGAPDTARTSTFPVVQIYDNAENVLWSNTAVLRVSADPTPAPSPPTSTPAPSPPTSVGPGTTRPTDAATTDTKSPADSTSDMSTTITTDSSEKLSADGNATGAKSPDADGGSSLVPVALIAVVVLAGGAALVIVRRRRS